MLIILSQVIEILEAVFIMRRLISASIIGTVFVRHWLLTWELSILGCLFGTAGSRCWFCVLSFWIALSLESWARRKDFLGREACLEGSSKMIPSILELGSRDCTFKEADNNTRVESDAKQSPHYMALRHRARVATRTAGDGMIRERHSSHSCTCCR